VKDSVGKITIVERESKIGIGRGSTARVIGRGGGLHCRSWIKKIQIEILHPLTHTTQPPLLPLQLQASRERRKKEGTKK